MTKPEGDCHRREDEIWNLSGTRASTAADLGPDLQASRAPPSSVRVQTRVRHDHLQFRRVNIPRHAAAAKAELEG